MSDHKSSGAMTPIDDWFFDWLREHKCWNRSAGWKCFEADGIGVYWVWTKAFEEAKVTEADALEASERMAKEKASYPEDHLSRLLALSRALASTIGTPARSAAACMLGQISVSISTPTAGRK